MRKVDGKRTRIRMADQNQSTHPDAYEDTRVALRKLLSLLDDPQPETHQWRLAVARARIDLAQEMKFACP